MKALDCQYFPCHNFCEACFDCDYCYCPLYDLDCGGDFIILPNGIKDCSKCIKPHDIRQREDFDKLIKDKNEY